MKDALHAQGWYLSDDAIAMLQEQLGPENATSIDAITAAALDHDLRQIIDTTDNAFKGATRLESLLVLQLNEVRNVAMPSTHQVEKPRLLRMHFSGGTKKKWVGVEMQGPVESINLMTPPGTKFLVTRPIEIRSSSFLILGPGLLKPLGGHVQDMVQAWRSGKQFVKRFRGRQQGDEESGPPAFVPFKIERKPIPAQGTEEPEKVRGQRQQRSGKEKKGVKQGAKERNVKSNNQQQGAKENNACGVQAVENDDNKRQQQPSKRPHHPLKEKKKPSRPQQQPAVSDTPPGTQGLVPEQSGSASSTKPKGRRPPKMGVEKQTDENVASKPKGQQRPSKTAEKDDGKKKPLNQRRQRPPPPPSSSAKDKAQPEQPANEVSQDVNKQQPADDHPRNRRRPPKRVNNNDNPAAQAQTPDGANPTASATKKPPTRPPRNKPNADGRNARRHPSGQASRASDQQQQS